jgi:hypothetical protein
MKTIINKLKAFAFFITFVTFVFSFGSCLDDTKSTVEVVKEEVVKAKLTASPWKIGQVTVGGVDQSSLYPNLVITFTEKGFTTVNGGVIWPATGTWVFTSSNATSIETSNGLMIDIAEITDTTLKLVLQWDKTTIGTGRSKSISGLHVFSFGK